MSDTGAEFRLELEVVTDPATAERFLAPRSAAALHRFMVRHLGGRDAAFALWRSHGLEPAPGVCVGAATGRAIYDKAAKIALRSLLERMAVLARNPRVAAQWRAVAATRAEKAAEKAKAEAVQRATERSQQAEALARNARVAAEWKAKATAVALAAIKADETDLEPDLKLVKHKPTPQELASFLERFEIVRKERERLLMGGGTSNDVGPHKTRALSHGRGPVRDEIGDEAGTLANRYRQHARMLPRDAEDELDGNERLSLHWRRAGGGWTTCSG